MWKLKEFHCTCNSPFHTIFVALPFDSSLNCLPHHVVLCFSLLLPCAELVTESANVCCLWPIFQRFIFKSQVVAANKYDIKKGKDFVWVTKSELLEYFPEQAGYLDKMIIGLL